MTTTAHEDQFTPAPVEVTQADPDDIVTMAKELAADPSNTLYGNTVLGVMCATIIDLRADLAKARTASASAGEVEPVAWMYSSPYGKELCKFRYARDEGRTPDDWVGWTETPLYAHPPVPADLVELVTILHQYRSDMLRPPTPDSRERRVAMIDAAIAKHGGA